MRLAATWGADSGVRSAARRLREALFLLAALAGAAHGRTFSLNLSPEALTRAAAAVHPASRSGAQVAGESDGRAVLSILLGPAEELAEVRAPWPVVNLGTGFYHGNGIAHLAVDPTMVAGAAGPVCLTLVTRPATVTVARPQRADAARDARIARDLASLALNALPAVAAGGLAGEPAEAPGDFRPAAAPGLSGSPVQMLILTRESLQGAFQVYADYRTGLGIPTVVRTVEWISQNYPHGADLAETLRHFVREAYELWGIRSLLLGGDTELLPTRYAYSVYSLEGDAIPTDLYYACLDGTWNADRDEHWAEGFTYATNSSDLADLYPELWVGRLPVSTTAQVSDLRTKLQAYLEPSARDYQDRLLFLAEVIWPANYVPGDQILKNGADNAERILSLNQSALATWSRQRLYETAAFFPGSLPLTRTAALAEMQAGYGIVAHIGHGFRYTMSLGDASLTNVQALALANASRPFFLNMLNCSAGAFDFPCLAEKFLLNPQGGAIGVIGAAREAYPDNIQLYQEAWFAKVVSEGFTGAAEALHEARLKLLGQTYEDGAYRWSNFITAYLGDPELSLWVGRPHPVVVTAPASIPVGTRTLTVAVTDASGTPVAGVRVLAWKPGEFYSLGHTGLGGAVSLPIDAALQGPALVGVAGAGVLPQRLAVQVGPAATAVLHVAAPVQVTDAGAGTDGNGNSRLEAGETAQLRLTVENHGGTAATAVTLELRSPEPALVVGTSAPVGLGTLAAGGSVVSPPITVTVADNVLDATTLELAAVLRSAQGLVVTKPVRVDLLQVAPQVQRLYVNDQSLGNGNGVPDAGETYDLLIDLKNYGNAVLQAASGRLSSTDPEVTILTTGAVPFGSLAHLEVGSATFRLRESSVREPNRMQLEVQDAGGRTWRVPIETRRPQPPTALAGDVSMGRGMVQLDWAASPSSDVGGYVVYRASREVGPWTRASLDPVRTALFFRDEALPDGARFFYRVAALDSSGNESARTPALDLTTNPGEVPPWPLQLGMWSNCSPVVADLHGDLHPEIVVGAADRIYAWNANGSELADGDANPATNGAWNTVTGNFMPGLACGDVDADGRDEVLACTYDTKQVYVFEGDGSVRAGWPRPIVSTTHGIWATPALGDLDLDGSLEIVVLALDGRLYAWHADGSEVRDGDANPATQGVFFVVPGTANWSRGAPAIANLLPDDATPEIIFGTENNRIYVLRASGSVAAGWPRTVGGKVDAAMSLGDIDADGQLEIAVPALDGMLYVLKRDGTNLSGWPRALENKWGALTPAVALHDFDGDGRLELVVASTGAVTDQGKLYMFDAAGNVQAGWPVDLHTASEASPLIGDLDGDGVPEIVFGGESGILYGYRPDGRPFPGFPIRVGAEVRATPLIIDADMDGLTELLFSGWDQQVYLWHFPGLFVRRHVPWGALKGNLLRNGVYEHREPTDAPPAALPRRSALRGNVPNPFNPSTRLHFDVAAGAGRIELVLFDVRGCRVRALVDETRPAGRYTADWDGTDQAGRPLPSGIYFARLVAADATATAKLVLLR